MVRRWGWERRGKKERGRGRERGEKEVRGPGPETVGNGGTRCGRAGWTAVVGRRRSSSSGGGGGGDDDDWGLSPEDFFPLTRSAFFAAGSVERKLEARVCERVERDRGTAGVDG